MISNFINSRKSYLLEYLLFRNSLSKKRGFELSWEDRRPFLNEKTKNTSFDRHYIYHPAWAARILAKNKPKYHVDISSTLNFCAIVSAFIPVKFYDYRPANLFLPNLTVDSVDLTSLPFKDGSIRSLSCMHTVEHIGLGRYGDKLDPNGDLLAIKELKRVLAVGGSLLFAVPLGRARIYFNAHRVYSLKQVRSYFSNLTLREFAIIGDKDDGRGLIINPSEKFCDRQKYGCGCFWFIK